MNPELKVVVGGVHASAVPDLVLARPHVDYVVIGEGDHAFPHILKAIERKDFNTPIDNTRYKNPLGKTIVGIQKGFNQDLDALPYFDKILWEEHVRIGDMYLTMASRGCPYRCTFCFNNFFAKLPEEKSGKYVRIRSVDHMLGELQFAKRRYNLKIIDFEDDVFTTSKKWLYEFLPRYKKEIGIPFSALTHPRYMDDDVAKWLKEAGGEWIQMGVQSMDESFKKDNLMRYERSDHIENALKVMHKYGLNVKVDHMLGLPNEPIESQEVSRKLYALHYPKRIQTFWTCYLPGTAMMKDAVEKGDLTKEQEKRINEGEEFYFFRNTDNIKDKSLIALYKAYELIYRIMPILPNNIRIKVLPKHLYYIPGIFVRPISWFTDIFSAFFHGVPEFKAYFLHNLFHLSKFFGKKIGIKNFYASKIINEVQPQDFFPKKYVSISSQQVAESTNSTEIVS